MKLYSVKGGPPSSAVRQALKFLNLQYELKKVDYIAGDHMTESYKEMNPQKEIPVLDDGFFLSESNAILQYLCDKYAPDSNLYPKDPKTRAIINQRLCFNLSTYYRYICEYSMDPLWFGYEQSPERLKKLHIALNIFNTYLEKSGTKYAASDHLTIADFQFVTATMCLEATKFDFSMYPLISKWYNNYKKEYPELWSIAKGDMDMLIEWISSPPDLSHLNHPIHPVRIHDK